MDDLKEGVVHGLPDQLGGLVGGQRLGGGEAPSFASSHLKRPRLGRLTEAILLYTPDIHI